MVCELKEGLVERSLPAKQQKQAKPAHDPHSSQDNLVDIPEDDVSCCWFTAQLVNKIK